MAALREEVKLFIIHRLACFDTPTEVAVAVKEEFGIEVDRSHVGIYDPTTLKGSELGKKFKEIFETTRNALLSDQIVIPIASKNFRLRALQKIYERALAKKNDVMAMEVLEQAAKETGGIYTNKIKLGGDAENPLALWLQQIGNTSLPLASHVEGEKIVETVAIENDAKPELEKDKLDKPKKVRKMPVGRD